MKRIGFNFVPTLLVQHFESLLTTKYIDISGAILFWILTVISLGDITECIMFM